MPKLRLPGISSNRARVSSLVGETTRFFAQVAPKRLKENPSDLEDNVQDAFLRGLEAERFLVKNMRRKVNYFFGQHV